MHANIYAFTTTSPDEVKPEYEQGAAYARSQGIPASTTEHIHYQFNLGTQEPVRPGEERRMLPSVSPITDLDAFSRYLEELLDQPIQLEGQSPDTVEGYVNGSPAGEDIFGRDRRSLTPAELAQLSPAVRSRIKTE